MHLIPRMHLVLTRALIESLDSLEKKFNSRESVGLNPTLINCSKIVVTKMNYFINH